MLSLNSDFFFVLLYVLLQLLLVFRPVVFDFICFRCYKQFWFYLTKTGTRLYGFSFVVGVIIFTLKPYTSAGVPNRHPVGVGLAENQIKYATCH